MLFKQNKSHGKVSARCGYCKKELYRYPSQLAEKENVYCSEECRWQAERKPNLQCNYCGKPFHRSQSEIDRSAEAGCTRAYCSRECYERARQEGIAEGYRPVGRWGKHYVECAHCGKPMYLRPSILQNRQHHFCSEECKRQFQVRGGIWTARKHCKQQHTHCQVCELEEPEILVAHHRDGNRKNNHQENLLVVCPNCHVRIHKGAIQV